MIVEVKEPIHFAGRVTDFNDLSFQSSIGMPWTIFPCSADADYLKRLLGEYEYRAAVERGVIEEEPHDL